MRIRSLKPGFWVSSDIAALEEVVAHHYTGLWCYCQDNGVGRDEARLIKAALYPLRDAVDVVEVERRQDVLWRAGLIVRYTEGGVPLFHIPTWDAHQKVTRPSHCKYLPPQGAPTEPSMGCREPSVSPQWGSANGVGNGEWGVGMGSGVQELGGEAADAARQGNPMAEIMPLVRHLFYLDTGPPSDWDEDRDANIAKAILRKSTSVAELQDAIRGMRLAVDRGQLRDWTPPVGPGEKMTLRILYHTKSGVLPTWTVALNALHSAHTHQDAPQRTKSRPLSLSDTPMPFGPQEAA